MMMALMVVGVVLSVRAIMEISCESGTGVRQK